ncbi:hypothetical protein USDA257_c02020 [Sinorhizobium fredii USDA 257]|uniref:Uncharacterized protein n=2 Tax=Rhizobium fredii TaxID=380 RepID=I3WYU6_SINF2|nr:hypothetical protein USDA257_c02020 [Sinorhizobium fredii USDA 257]
MGVSQRTIQRSIKSLEAKGFISKSRTEDGRPFYDVAPTKERLLPYAEKLLQEKRQLRQLKQMLPRSDQGQSNAGAIDGTER